MKSLFYVTFYVTMFLSYFSISMFEQIATVIDVSYHVLRVILHVYRRRTHLQLRFSFYEKEKT